MVHTIASAENLIKNIISMDWQMNALDSNLNSMIEIRDDNFASPLSALPHVGFLCPAKVMGWGWGKILTLHHRVGRASI